MWRRTSTSSSPCSPAELEGSSFGPVEREGLHPAADRATLPQGSTWRGVDERMGAE